MITRRTLFGFAMVPLAPKPEALSRVLEDAIVRQFYAPIWARQRIGLVLINEVPRAWIDSE